MRIKEIREARNIMQKKMAADIGLAANTLSQYENGKREPDIETTKRIAEYLGVSVDTLVGGEGIENAPGGEAGREVGDEDIKFALFGGGGEITDAMYEEVRNFAAYVKQREAEKKE